MPVPALEIAVGTMTAVLLLREARAIIREGKESRNGTGLTGAITELTKAIAAKEVKDTERHGNIVGHIKDSERRLTDHIGECRK